MATMTLDLPPETCQCALVEIGRRGAAVETVAAKLLTRQLASVHLSERDRTTTVLREATRVVDGALWGACVVRIDRETQEITVEFEYDHPERWNVTPQNYAEIAARARVG